MSATRVDLAISPPGLIRGARCHTLLADDQGVAIVHVCRGWRVNFSPRGMLKQAVANATLRHLRTKAEQATAALAGDLRGLAAGKGGAVLAWSDVSNVQWNAEYLDLRFTGAGKRYRFQFEEPEAAAAGAFAAAISSRAGR